MSYRQPNRFSRRPRGSPRQNQYRGWPSNTGYDSDLEIQSTSMSYRQPNRFSRRPRGSPRQNQYRGWPSNTGYDSDLGWFGPPYSPPQHYDTMFDYFNSFEGFGSYAGYPDLDHTQHTSPDASIKTYSNSPEVVLKMMRHDVVFKVVSTSPQHHVVVQLEGQEFLGVGASEKDARTEAAKETMRRFFDMHHVSATPPPANKPTSMVDEKQSKSKKKDTKGKSKGKRNRKGTKTKEKACITPGKEMDQVEPRSKKESVEDTETDESTDDEFDDTCRSKSERPLKYEEAENFIFQYLVEEFDGIVKYAEFIEKCSPGKDVDNWLRKQRHRFHVFEENGEILFIAPYMRDAAYCLDYTGATKQKKCFKKNCELIHICQHHMRGYCRRGNRCWRSHDYSDEHNLRVKQTLGLGTFEDAEISNILINRYPQVCPKRYCRGKKKCPYLHICRKYVIGKCAFKRCKIGHSFKTEHNAWVLKVYGMENIDDSSILSLVSIARLKHKQSGYDSNGSSVNGLESLGGDLSDLSLSDTDSETEMDGHSLPLQGASLIGRESPMSKNESRFDSNQNKELALTRGDQLTIEGCRFDSYHQKKELALFCGDQSYTEGCRFDPHHQTKDLALSRGGPSSTEGSRFDAYYRMKELALSRGDQSSTEESRSEAYYRMKELALSRGDQSSTEGSRFYPYCQKKEFLMASVDQSSTEGRRFNLHNQNQELVLSCTELSNKEKKQGVPSGDDRMTLKEDGENEETLCCDYIVGKCDQVTCGYIHTPYRMPYLWQAHTEGEWMSFTKAENENIEKAFCGKQNIVDSEIQIGFRLYKLHIHFDNEYFGVVYKIADFSVQKGRQLKIHRLSTPSFAKVIREISPSNEPFRTQWRWYFQGNIKQWKIFRKAEEQSTLERKYLSGQRYYLYSRDTNGYQYRINFDAMDQVNIQNGTTRPLLRRPLYVPEENVRKNKFPQSLMVDLRTDLPFHWSPLDISGVEYELVELESGLEFRNVQESFFETLDENLYDVDMVYRVQNSRLWKSYSMKKLFMTHKARLSNGDQTIDERDLFHHAESLERCSKIFTNSFDSRMSATDAMFCCGKGAHFTLNSNLADQWANRGERKRLMLRAKVLVGDYTKGERSFECPPFIPGEGYSLFDSCVDDVTSPQIFVTFDTNQSYPEYLIQYTIKEESNDNSVTLCPSPENTSELPCLPDSCSAFNPMMKVTEQSLSSREVEKVIETDNTSYHSAYQELLTQEEQVHIPFPTQKDLVPTEVHIKEEFVAKASATHEASDPKSVSTQKELVTKFQPFQEEMVDNLSPTREKLIQKVSPLQEEFVQNYTVRNQDNLNQKGDLSAVEDVIPTVSTAHDQLVSEVDIAQALSNSKVAYQKEPSYLHPDSTSCNSKMIQIMEGHFQKDIASDEPQRVPISENISSTLIDQDTALKMFQSKSEETNQEMQITPARLAQNSEITRDGILPKQPDAENRKLVEKKNCTSLNTSTGRQSENERKPLANDKQKKGKNCRVQ